MFANQFLLIIISALIFIASFLWKDFLKEVEEIIFPSSTGLFLRFLYTLTLSSILIAISVYLRNHYFEATNTNNNREVMGEHTSPDTSTSLIRLDSNPGNTRNFDTNASNFNSNE